MKAIKKIAIVIFSLFLTFCIGFGLLILFWEAPWENEEKSARGQIRVSFGLEVPKEAQLAYYYDDKAFQDWTKYCVFTFENEPTEWLQTSEFSQKKDSAFEHSINEFLRWRTDGGNDDTPQEYIPTFDKEYFWITKGTYFLVYIPDNSMLIAYFVNM